uniref:Tumor protein p53 inducible nuclear protein 2 n=1 Tax=Oryzias latipes TaxID=8090 RepID=A0A3P9JY07_ORYLA
MFQRLSNLLFGEVEEVAAELKGPNPCLTEADEEGWMLVNLPAVDCRMQVEDKTGTLSEHNVSLEHPNAHTRTECRPPNKRRRTHKGRGSAEPSNVPPGFSTSSIHLSAVTPMSLPRQVRLSTPSSTPSMSPDPGKGATAEASPMEDLLIEHPSMSVYVSPNNTSMVSTSDLSVVGEECILSLASSVSRVSEPGVIPAARSTMPTRVTRGGAAHPGALAKVTQVARVQRCKARIDRRHLSRNHIQRQNRTREQVPCHAARARNTFLHQPSKRNFCH